VDGSQGDAAVVASEGSAPYPRIPRRRRGTFTGLISKPGTSAGRMLDRALPDRLFRSPAPHRAGARLNASTLPGRIRKNGTDVSGNLNAVTRAVHENRSKFVAWQCEGPAAPAAGKCNVAGIQSGDWVVRITPGHAPSDIREEVCELAGDRNLWESKRSQQVWGILWNCTDIVPSGTCWVLDEPLGSTYAMLARSMSRWLRRKSVSVKPR
jgi:hypothetical protein